MTNNWLVIWQEQNIATQVLQANQHSQRFGLVLTEEDAKLIAQESSRTLKEQMRVEFGPGIAQKIIYEFCNSAYLNPNNFTNSIIRLQEIFYLYKNEMEDEITVALQKEYKKVANKIHIHQQKSFVFYLQLQQKKNRKKRLRNLFKSFLNAFFNQFFRSCQPFAFLHNPAKSGVCQACIPANLINHSPEHYKFCPDNLILYVWIARCIANQ